MTITARTLFSWLLVALVACSGPPEPAPQNAVETQVDGVRVVENIAPLWSEDERWRISSEPVWTLGVDIGAPEEMFSAGFVYPPFALNDGRIVVPDFAGEVRYFDADGTFVGAAGRAGQGPCEFGRIGPAYPAGDDSIAVWDTRLDRVVTFDGSAECASTSTLAQHDESYGRPQLVGRFADGTLFAMAYDAFPRGVSGTRISRMGAFFRYQPDGSAPRLLLELAVSESVIGSEWPVVFSTTPLVLAHDDGIYHAPGDTTEVLAYDTDGTLTQRFHRRYEPRPVSQADRDAWTQMSRRNVDMLERDREFAERMLSLATFDDVMPEVRSLLVDELGDTWAERHLGLAHTRPIMIGEGREQFPVDSSTWDVFAPDGIWLGTVDLVAGREPTFIADDYVLMRGADEAGVAQVWKYALIKPD